MVVQKIILQKNIVEDIIKKQQIQKIDNIVITNKAMNTDFIKKCYGRII